MSSTTSPPRSPLTTDDLPSSPAEVAALIASLREQASHATSDLEGKAVISRIAQIVRAFRIRNGIGLPLTPIEQARELDAKFRTRPHLDLLGRRICDAVCAVERGRNQQIAVSMPPRAGKSTTISLHSVVWLLRRHPEWPIVTASYDSSLSGTWARNARRIIEDHPDLGIALASDGGAGSRWETVEGGGVYSTSVRGALTGRGARVMIIDDPVRDFVEAHSLVIRQNLWDWWLSVAQTRLEPPYLVIVVMTRWHEDDFIGRLFSDDHEGDPRTWQRISLPALAEPDDAAGRVEGEPLLSPLMEETPAQASRRWEDVRRAVGSYTFSAMYQQRPAPARGAIFDAGWWRFWTINPGRVTEDGRVMHIDPGTFTGGRWVDSWDCAFKATHPDTGGWVVGQRWVRQGANRYLIAQQRGRWSFTQTLARMAEWEQTDNVIASPYGHLVHERLIEERANGAAIIDVIRERVAGIKPINPTVSKEARARAVTPEIESGNVFLPHPGDPGNEWVADLLSELRNFPYDAYDDQVDTLTQALASLRSVGRGSASVPGRMQANRPGWQISRDVARAALSDLSRRRQ
jgi:predicted phage terminase large subunit-like protein